MTKNKDLHLTGKKKAKKVIRIDDDLNEILDEVEEQVPAALATTNDEDSCELVLGKKKKPKRRALVLDDDDFAEFIDILPTRVDGVDIGYSNLLDAAFAWPDYSYEEMLSLALGEKDPSQPGGSGEGGGKRKFQMVPMQVQRVGSKKVALVNFKRICASMKREEKHVLQFLLAEMGTTGSIDGNHCLIVKGRFRERHFENVISNYVVEYKKCKTCNQHDTDLIKEPHTRLYFLSCRACGSSKSVAPIKSGFTALVGKRAVARRAAEAAAGR